MTPSETRLAALRTEAQELHRNVVALGHDDKKSMKDEIEKIQTKARKLGESLKLRAETEQGVVKARMHEAGTKLEAERSKIHASSDALKADIERAKLTLIDGMTSATRSLSEAVAAHRRALHDGTKKVSS